MLSFIHEEKAHAEDEKNTQSIWAARNHYCIITIMHVNTGFDFLCRQNTSDHRICGWGIPPTQRQREEKRTRLAFSLQAIRANCHPSSGSFSRPPVSQLIHPPQNFSRGVCRFQSPDFTTDAICAARLKKSRLTEDWDFRLSQRPVGTRYHRLICEGSCIRLAPVRLVINRPLASSSKDNRQHLLGPWHTAHCVSAVYITLNTRRATGGAINMREILEDLLRSIAWMLRPRFMSLY